MLSVVNILNCLYSRSMKSMRLIIIIIIIIHHELGLYRRVLAYEIKLYHNVWNTFHKRFTVDGAGIEVFYMKANLIFGITKDRDSPSLCPLKHI
jgi:hypothetical protein